MCNGAANVRLLEATGVWEAYADGVASVEVYGPVARITYFKFRMVDGEKAMVPVAEIELPANVCGSGVVVEMMRRARITGRATINDCANETAH